MISSWGQDFAAGNDEQFAAIHRLMLMNLYFYFWLQKCSDHLFIETWKIPPVHVVPHQSRSKMAPTARIRQHPRGRVVLPGCGRNGLVEFDLLSGLKFWLDWASISCGECVSRNAWTSKKLCVRMIAARTKPQIHVYANVRSQSESDHPCSFEPNHGGQLEVPLIRYCLRVGYTLDSRPYLYNINIAAPFHTLSLAWKTSRNSLSVGPLGLLSTPLYCTSHSQSDQRLVCSFNSGQRSVNVLPNLAERTAGASSFK